MQLTNQFSFRKVLIIFFVGIIILAFFLNFLSPYENIFTPKNESFILIYSRNIFLALTFELNYTIPYFIIYLTLYIFFINRFNFFLGVFWGIFAGVFAYFVVFSYFHFKSSFNENFYEELKKFKDLFYCSGLTGGCFAGFLKRYLKLI